MDMARLYRLLAESPDSPFCERLREFRKRLDDQRAWLAQFALRTDRAPTAEEKAWADAVLPGLETWSRACGELLEGVRARDRGAILRSLAQADRLAASGLRATLAQARGRQISARSRELALAVHKVEEHLASLGSPAAEEARVAGDAGHASEALRTLEEAIRAATSSYIRTTPFLRIESEEGPLFLTIKHILLLGAITASDVLLLGRTGTGKTKLASKVMEALFGRDGYYGKTTLPSMSPGDFMDIDFPAIKSGRKTLKEAIQGVPALTKPGIVINEANRAPALVQAMLIPFLDREFEIEGVPVEVGVEHGGERYQYRILTINEGELYAVEEMDRAIRDRAGIEVPVDLFPQSPADVRDMLAVSSVPSGGGDSGGHLEAVLKVYDEARRVPATEEAKQFIAYLAGLGNCIRSVTGTKEGISFTPEICAGCHHANHFYNNLCGNIRAPSPRALVNLQRVAQGVALLRAHCQGKAAVAVALEDVLAAAPMVLLNKMELDPTWLVTAGPKGREFRGCAWMAIGAILEFLVGRYLHFAAACGREFARYVSGEPMSPGGLDALEKYARDEDAWGVNLVELARRRELEVQRALQGTRPGPGSPQEAAGASG